MAGLWKFKNADLTDGSVVGGGGGDMDDNQHTGEVSAISASIHLK
jgi:hypothetical protein